MLLESSKKIVDEVLSCEVFKGLDKEALLKKHGLANNIYGVDVEFSSHKDQQSQDAKIINSIRPEGIEINKPGKYELSNDITWNPINATSSAITIKSSNVELDMKNFCINTVSGDKVHNSSGATSPTLASSLC